MKAKMLIKPLCFRKFYICIVINKACDLLLGKEYGDRQRGIFVTGEKVLLYWVEKTQAYWQENSSQANGTILNMLRCSPNLKCCR